MSKVYCANCNGERDFDIKFVKETFTVRGEKVEVIVKECYCMECGESVTVDSILNENMKNVYNAYKKKKGLLTSEEIKAIRKKRGLSQTDVARLIGCGEKTITRYESGYIQDDAFDRFLRLIDDDISYFVIEQKFGWSDLEIKDNLFSLFNKTFNYLNVNSISYKCDNEKNNSKTDYLIIETNSELKQTGKEQNIYA